MLSSRESKIETIKNSNSAAYAFGQNDVDILIFFGVMLDKLRKSLGPIFDLPIVKYGLTITNFIFQPLAMIFAIRKAYLDKTTHSKLNAVVQVVSGLAIIVASIGIIASIAALAFVTPILLTAAIGLKTLFDFGSAIYFGVTALKFEKGSAERTEYATLAREYALNTVIGAVATAAAVVLMLFAAPVVQLAVSATAVAVTAAGMLLGAIHFFFKDKPEARAAVHADVAENNGKRTPAVVYRALGVSPSTNLSIVDKADEATKVVGTVYSDVPAASQTLEGQKEYSFTKLGM